MPDQGRAGNRTTIGSAFTSATWDVSCLDCDYLAEGISSYATALVVAQMHAKAVTDA